LGDLRDGFLVAAGASYVLGYLVWSLNAWQNNLGLLPALESQYFVAGIIPLLIIVLAVLIFRGERRFRRRYSDWLSSEKRGRWRLRFLRGIAWSFTISIFLTVLLALLQVWIPVLEHGAAYIGWFWIVILLLLPDSELEGPGGGFLKFFQKLLVYFIVLFLAVLSIAFYLEVVYPKITQEFGRVRPRFAYFDVSQHLVSEQTLEQILSADALNSSRQVVQSKKVDVYFSGHSFILIKLHGQGATQPTFEIKQNAVQAITWCD